MLLHMFFTDSCFLPLSLRMKLPFFLIAGSILLNGVVSGTVLIAGEAEETGQWFPPYLMFSDPALEVPKNPDVLPENIVELWRTALRGSDASHRLAAANDLSVAWSRGFEEVKAAVPELRKLLQDESETVRSIAARLLVELDAREAADELFNCSQKSGSQFRMLVEPALAKWNYQPVLSVWRSRFKDRSVFRRELIMACRGCGQEKDKQALEDLMKIVHSNDRSRDVRLAAAEAAGQIAESGLEQDARKLMETENSPLINRLCAVALLERHRSKQAQKLLVQLFDDSSAPVAAAAIRRLLEIDPALVLDLSPRAWKHSDVNIRQAAAECLDALPNADRLVNLAGHLHDPDPKLRDFIRGSLLKHVKNQEYKTVVVDRVVGVLNSDQWRGQEQACLILGQLEYEPAAERLVQLISSDRPEVMIASAWALKKIALESTLPAMLAQAQLQTSRPKGENLQAVDRQVAHLFEAMAVMKYRQAIPLMRQYIPFQDRRRYQRLSRGAAIWGLGHLLADDQDDRFASQLMGRIKAASSMKPEIGVVVYMSTISLGRIKASSQLEGLKKLAEQSVSASREGQAAKWAIQQISGESITLDQAVPNVLRIWRIQPKVTR